MASKAIGQITLTSVSDGTDGKSPIQVLLSNETHILSADSNGNVISYAGAETYVYVFDGVTDVTHKYKINAIENGVSGILDSNRYTVTNISNGVGGTVEFVCVGPDNESISKVFSISLSKQGIPGQNGEDGQDGTPGPAGADGRTSYFHVKYSPVANPTPDQMTEVPDEYIGTYVDFIEEDSTDPGMYSWSRFQGLPGEQGIPGQDGANGKTSYLHIRYSDDGGLSFTSNQGKTPGDYLGQYVDYVEEDSNNVYDYTWSKIKGEQGIQGLQGIQGEQGIQGVPGPAGSDGQTSYFHIKYSDIPEPTQPSDMSETPKDYIGTYVDFTQEDSTDPNDYTWSRFTGMQGEQGIPGQTGASGKTSYLHIKYSNDGGNTFTGNSGEDVGDYIGQYVDFSEEDSSNVSDYKWSKIKGDKGSTGETGVGISSVKEMYYLSSSSTVLSGGTWVESYPGWENGKYIWTKSIITYSNSTSTETTPICVSGSEGQTGPAGADGTSVTIKGSYNSVEELESAHPTGADGDSYLVNGDLYVWDGETSSWKNVGTIQGPQGEQGIPGQDGADGSPGTDGKSAYQIWLEAGNTGTEQDYLNSLKGEQGQTGPAGSPGKDGTDGVSITNVDVYYYRSTSSTSMVGGSWSTDYPGWENGTYLWSKTITTYSTGETSETTPVCITGSKGQTGAQGPQGTPGQDAKLLSITASSQVFKSTTGKDGTYSPSEIIITPTLQNVSFSKWQYSTDGTSWNDVVSGQNGLSVSGNTLTVQNDSSLFSGMVAVSFKCLSTDNMYDTITILKTFDSTDSIIQSNVEPDSPSEGTLWLNTNNGILYVYIDGNWVGANLDDYMSREEVNNAINNRSKVFIHKPEPPYSEGDLWIVQDPEDENYGKILTCLISKDVNEAFSIDDWFIPLTAYATLTQMTNVIGKDPSEWSTTSKSITTLINENTNKIAGVQEQSSMLAVRASDIEMSFSITGTMNFLGNSSGQNGTKLWTITSGYEQLISTASANEASDVQAQLVSGSAYRFISEWSTLNVDHIDFVSDLFVPPTSDQYTVSAKIKNLSKYLNIKLIVSSYSDANGEVLLGTDTLDIPYSINNEGSFYVEHMVLDKNKYSSQVVRIKLCVQFCKVPIITASLLPTYGSSYIGKAYLISGKYYYGSSLFTKVNVVKSSTPPTLKIDEVWLCSENVPNDSDTGYDYIAGFYYQDIDGVLEPIVDNYVITMLDAGQYYKRVPSSSWESVTGESSTSFLTPEPGSVYFGDIMVNGGSMVMTWTPRQDENMWGTKIKFNSSGITIEDRSRGYKRVLDESSDISWQISSDGSIISCVWKLTQDGFITKDIKCYGTFYMGYVPNEKSENIDTEFIKVMSMQRSNDNSGIDEYIYT